MTKQTFLSNLWLFAVIGIGIAAASYQGYHEYRRTRMVADGVTAHDFSLEAHGGGTLQLSELRGKVVMLDFWATWCGPCKQEFPFLVKLAREFADRGVVLVAADQIESDSKAAVGVFLARTGIELPPNAKVVYAPNTVFDQYQVQALPTLYFIDREGRIAHAIQALADEEMVRYHLEKLTAAR